VQSIESVLWGMLLEIDLVEDAESLCALWSDFYR
jgi:hypothetical protein